MRLAALRLYGLWLCSLMTGSLLSDAGRFFFFFLLCSSNWLSPHCSGEYCLSWVQKRGHHGGFFLSRSVALTLLFRCVEVQIDWGCQNSVGQINGAMPVFFVVFFFLIQWQIHSFCNLSLCCLKYTLVSRVRGWTLGLGLSWDLGFAFSSSMIRASPLSPWASVPSPGKWTW